MEGSVGLGLGFAGTTSAAGGGGSVASMSFVPAVAKDNNNHKTNNFSTNASFAITKDNNYHQSPIHNNTTMHNNNNNNQQQHHPLPPSMQNHITSTTLPHYTTNQYSQPQYSFINNIQQHLPPSSSAVHYPPPTASSYSIPPVATHQSVMQCSLPPSSIVQQQHHQQQQQYSLPSFQPPPGMPPVVANNAAPTSFPPPQSYYNTAVHQEIKQPQHQIQHAVLPSAAAAPAPVTMQQQKQQEPMTSTMQTAQPIIQQYHSQHEQQNLHAQLPNNNNDGHDDDPLQKARAIAMKFHKESTNTSMNDTSIPTNIHYAQQRQQYFQGEEQKLASFKLKNLEYIMKHEECMLRKHVNVMNELTAYEEKQEIQLHKQQCKQRQFDKERKQQQREQVGMLNEDGCGIGTKEQRHAERVRKQQQQQQQQSDLTNNTMNNTNHHNKNKKKKVSLRTSLYLTNLPTTNDNGSSSSICNERTLQSLFSNYGRLDRVIMYRHRDTGELKGDGLIVFGRDAVEEYWTKKNDEDGIMDLVEAVCTQMNGAELPCGTVIGVEIADMNYKKKKKKMQEDDGKQSPPSVSEVVNNNNKSMNDNVTKSTIASRKTFENGVAGEDQQQSQTDDGDDLDDFFASLE